MRGTLLIFENSKVVPDYRKETLLFYKLNRPTLQNLQTLKLQKLRTRFLNVITNCSEDKIYTQQIVTSDMIKRFLRNC
jgi:hypothetical protein